MKKKEEKERLVMIEGPKSQICRQPAVAKAMSAGLSLRTQESLSEGITFFFSICLFFGPGPEVGGRINFDRTTL
jgi:hypothetical protein